MAPPSANTRATGLPRRRRVRSGIQSQPTRVEPATVSVVIPCYNYAGYLPASIDSVLTQSGVAVDVVIVDDSSTDSSVEVAQRIAKEDPRVRVFENPHNQGPVATFNHGLAEATGEFVVRLDADDLLTPGSLARAIALFDAFPSVGLVYGHPVHFSGPPPKDVRQSVRGWTVWPGAEWLDRRCRLGVNCITSPEVVMRHSVVDRVGGQRDLDQTHDMEMWMRLSAASDVGHVDGPDQALHREHDRSRSAVMVDSLTDLRERRLAFEMLFDGVGSELPDGAAMRERAMRAMAAEALERVCHAYDRGRVATTPIAELIEFAVEVYPQSNQLARWRAVQRRQKVGARRARFVPPFVAMAFARRARDVVAYRRWTRTGL